jgi:hypothetical protein
MAMSDMKYFARIKRNSTGTIGVSLSETFVGKKKKKLAIFFRYADGDHGGDNNDESMHPVFVARGPSFKQNYLAKQFDNVDLYILMCTILKISQVGPHNGSYENIKAMLSTQADKLPSFFSNSYHLLFAYIFLLCIFLLAVKRILFEIKAEKRTSLKYWPSQVVGV